MVWDKAARSTVLVMMVLLCSESALAQGRTLFTTASGLWTEDIWHNRASPEDNAPPTPEDTVFIQADHTVIVQGRRDDHQAFEINIYGKLELTADAEDNARLTAKGIIVRGGGDLRAVGAHEIILLGIEPSYIAVREGASIHLEGAVSVDNGALTDFEELSDGTARLTDASQRWIPNGLTGQRLKFLSGRARLWSMTILSNTEDTLVLDVESRGAPRTISPLTAEVDPIDPRTLLAPGATFEVDPRGYRDKIVTGRHVRIGGPEGPLHLVIGFEDGPTDGLDTLRVWPPMALGVDEVAVAFTWGIESGDRYAITAPMVVTTPAEHRLPNPSQDRRHYIYVGDDTHSVFRHTLISHGFMDVRWIDGSTEREATTLHDIEIEHYDAGCGFHSQGLDGVIAAGFHIRDVHPDNDNTDHGGRWPAGAQRGHGLCYYGQNAVLRDNLLTNLNDDLLYISAGSNRLIEDNIAIGTDTFHGNSGESLTMFEFGGDVLIRRNVAMGSYLVALFDTRTTEGEVTIRDNIFIQDEGLEVAVDRSHNQTGRILWTNNVFINGRGGPVQINASDNPSDFSNNLMLGVALANVREAQNNISVGVEGSDSPLIIGGGSFTSNLIAAPGMTEQGALMGWPSGGAGPTLTRNTLDAGLGVAVRLPSGDPLGSFIQNLWVGAAAFEGPDQAPASSVGLRIEHNAFDAGTSLMSMPGWLALDETNLHAPIEWSNPSLYQLPADSVLQTENAPKGYLEAGLSDPSMLPDILTDLPERRASVTPIDEEPPIDVVTPDDDMPPTLGRLPQGKDPSETPNPAARDNTGCQTSAGQPTAPLWFVLFGCVWMGRRRGVSLRDRRRWP